MPEGPECAITADELNSKVSGLHIFKIKFFDRVKGNNIRQLPTKVKIESVISRGKHIIFKLQRSGRKRRFYILSRLGMEGHWGFDKKVKHIQLVLDLRKREKIVSEESEISHFYIKKYNLYFSDTRYFGGNDFCTTQEEYNFHFKQVGIDLIKESELITKKWWKEQIKNPRIKSKMIAKYLMEQHRFSGVGNYLKSEILFESRIYPGKKLSELSDKEIEKLRLVSLKLIKNSYESGGLTISTFYTPSGLKGTFKQKVYDKKYVKVNGKKYTVSKDEFDNKRKTHWVPKLQKL